MEGRKDDKSKLRYDLLDAEFEATSEQLYNLICEIVQEVVDNAA